MNLDKRDENFRGQIKVCLMLEDSAEPKNIVFWDNGCGMDRDDFQAYGTFAYSQEAREKDSANKLMKSPSKSPAKIQRENEICLLRKEGDPLTLTGNIGHFGVGAQNAVFFMGDMEHVMSRAVTASGKTPVEDMVVCVCVCVCVCLCVCMCVCVCMHTHTHTYTHTYVRMVD
jgi:hypothetical protein